ncbi:isopenicillin-N N-acyltransferase-like protein [Rhodoglobus vestalii]|uniref:Isopenicillin-N N-acyltransferase-like protein n=1 Tax=Rhodoglobus vestalii TaxID=193384 RepID=A0A8H2K8T2_9MICO|nr:C45 family peptidase [Rhodoglobus vestalii]TQO18826.1 isopenicillin-N N-acyltransferase-like protein [Rhodoglobus vestalii]
MIDYGPEIIRIDSTDAHERGLQRGSALRGTLADGVRIYLALFAQAGIHKDAVRSNAEQSIESARHWCPSLVEEMRGTAEGAGLELWQIAALNARTEILSSAAGARPGECSTIVNTRNAPVGAQTWDWHDELSDHWHLQDVHGNIRNFVGLTEHGILSKIGINDAGVGIMLNILGHQDDRPDGVPVHLVAARILAEASTLGEAVCILQSAPVSTSSAITVVSPDAAVIVELSPHGAVVLTPHDHVLLHTNHFLDEHLGRGEKPGLYDPDSQLRYGVLAGRVADSPLPMLASDLVPYLVSQPGDAAELCCVPQPGALLGDRWATLATITLDAVARQMTVSVGTPRDAPSVPLVTLVAE